MAYKGGLYPVNEKRAKALREELQANPEQRHFTIARPTLNACLYWAGRNVELMEENHKLRLELEQYKGLLSSQDNL